MTHSSSQGGEPASLSCALYPGLCLTGLRPVHTGKGNTKIFLQTQEELLFDQISGPLGAGSSDPCNYPPGSQHTMLSSLLSRNLPLSRTLQQRIKSWINHKQKCIPDDSGSWKESSEFSTSKKNYAS